MPSDSGRGAKGRNFAGYLLLSCYLISFGPLLLILVEFVSWVFACFVKLCCFADGGAFNLGKTLRDNGVVSGRGVDQNCGFAVNCWILYLLDGMIEVGSGVKECVAITVVELVGGNTFGLKGNSGGFWVSIEFNENVVVLDVFA